MDYPTFDFVTVHVEPLSKGIEQESAWVARCAATGEATAHLWHTPVGLVVPRRYTLLPGWPAANREAQVDVAVRASGGALVPQGPGVWNLSLVWTAPHAMPDGVDRVYRALCHDLSAALARLSIVAVAQAVEGSFCDGRYNLAANGRKLVGTAQAWRRIDRKMVVLAHAVIVIDADPVELTMRANSFEAALGTSTRYRADALTSIAHETAERNIAHRALSAIAAQFSRIAPEGR